MFNVQKVPSTMCSDLTHKGQWLTTAEAAQVLRLSASTLHRWRGQRKGPKCVRFGSKAYYRPADIDAWIEEQLEEQNGRE